MADKQQIEQLKKQLISQIDSLQNISSDQKTSMKQEILKKSDQEFIDFLVQNKMIAGAEGKSDRENPKEEKQQCIFCLIKDSKTPSYKIDENKEAIAILDINPMSKGHSIVLPRKHEQILKSSQKVLSLAKKVAKRIRNRLKAQNVEISTSEVMSHGIVNLIPLYKNQKLEKKQASKEELESLQKLLYSKPRPKKPVKLDDKNQEVKEKIGEKKTKEKNTDSNKSDKPTEKLPQAPVRLP